MDFLPAAIAALLSVAPQPLTSGDSSRTIDVDGQRRTYLVHVPTTYDAQTPMPAVLVFHGLGLNASRMVPFTRLNEKADQAGFITVYPEGIGVGVFRGFNAGGLDGPLAAGFPNDVTYVTRLLDDLESLLNIDSRRVFATGMSNGAMMCYRLAAELSHRIAAIAPVAGTMAVGLGKPKRPIPVIHFHGTADNIVPFGGPPEEAAEFLQIKSVEETVQFWAQVNHCRSQATVVPVDNTSDDGTNVTRSRYAAPSGEVRVVLYTIHGGGHTWPGQPPPRVFLGKSTEDISANDLIWEFFQKHPLPESHQE